MKIKDIGEIGLIERIAKGVRLDKTVVRGIGDDTAVIRWTKDRYLLFTCDMIVENVHFKMAGATPFQIGWKALCRNISDVAAMGGVPKYALVSAALPAGMKVSAAEGIFKGIKSAASRFGVNIVGGDTSKSDKIVIDVSLIGEVEKDKIVTRSGAKRGDAIMVTGSIGGSGRRKHLTFVPRVEEARMLVRDFKVSSMIDISDGLELDLMRILKAGKCGARIYESLIPVSKEASSLKEAIREGEDFELLFTMPPNEARRFFKTMFIKMNTPVTLIGEVMDRKYGFYLINEDGKRKRLGAGGYLHF